MAVKASAPRSRFTGRLRTELARHRRTSRDSALRQTSRSFPVPWPSTARRSPNRRWRASSPVPPRAHTGGGVAGEPERNRGGVPLCQDTVKVMGRVESGASPDSEIGSRPRRCPAPTHPPSARCTSERVNRMTCSARKRQVSCWNMSQTARQRWPGRPLLGRGRPLGSAPPLCLSTSRSEMDELSRFGTAIGASATKTFRIYHTLLRPLAAGFVTPLEHRYGPHPRQTLDLFLPPRRQARCRS